MVRITKLQHISLFCIVVLHFAQFYTLHGLKCYSVPGLVSAAVRAPRSPRRFRYTGGPTPGSWYYSKYVRYSCILSCQRCHIYITMAPTWGPGSRSTALEQLWCEIIKKSIMECYFR